MFAVLVKESHSETTVQTVFKGQRVSLSSVSPVNNV